MCDMDRLKICKKFKMFLIEDAAEAVGSLYKKKTWILRHSYCKF